MFNVIILGRTNDKKLHTILEKKLKKLFPLISVSPAGYWADENPEIVLLDYGNPASLNAEKTLIIVKQNSGYIPDFKIADNNTVIAVPSECKDAIDFAARCSIPTITCGLGSKDSFTFSSLTGEEAVISIQRTLTTFSGLLIEPSEIPVKLGEPTDSYSLLCLAVILSFTEKLDNLQEVLK